MGIFPVRPWGTDKADIGRRWYRGARGGDE